MAATASSDHRSGHNPPEAQDSTSEVLESEICDDNVLRKLRTFDVKSSDAQITQAVMDLRAYEDELREQYERLFLNLKHWVNTGLSFEFERAHDILKTNRAWIVEKEAELELRREKIVRCVTSIREAMQLLL